MAWFELQLGSWNKALKESRMELGCTGSVKINRGDDGVALYKRAKELHNNYKA